MTSKFKNDPKKKRYYWLQLKEGFFSQKEIKLLRGIAGGDTYTIIYLKMLLESLNDEGKLYFESIADNFSEEISLVINETKEDVNFIVNYLIKTNQIVKVSENAYQLMIFNNLVGGRQ